MYSFIIIVSYYYWLSTFASLSTIDQWPCLLHPTDVEYPTILNYRCSSISYAIYNLISGCSSRMEGININTSRSTISTSTTTTSIRRNSGSMRNVA